MLTAQSKLVIPPDLVQSIPYFSEYFGLWVIEPTAMTALFELASKLDIAAHLQSDRVAEFKNASPGQGGGYYRQDIESVAHISVNGPLQKQASSFSGGTSTVRVRQDVRAASRDPEIVAILMRIESPGGTFAGNSELAEEIERASAIKPVHAFINDIGASAAYWLATSTSHISANKESLVGSIGTYATIADYSAAAAKEGVKLHVIRAGEFKGMGTPGTEVTTQQLAEMQRHVDSRNQFFLDAVAKGRKVPLDYVKNQLADGRMHPASEAVGMKLIDSVASLEEAHERVKSAIPKKNQVRGTKMSESNTTHAAAPLTPGQIKTACPGASSDFIVDCIDRNMTIENASSLWTTKLSERVGELSKQNADLEGKLAEATKQNDELAAQKTKLEEELKAKESAPLVKSGVPGLPVSATSKSNAAATPADAYWAKVGEVCREKDMSRAKAMSYVNKNHPELVASMNGATA